MFDSFGCDDENDRSFGNPKRKVDEHSSKFPSVRNQGFIVQEKVNTPEGDAC
jgi:hypothetical protein